MAKSSSPISGVAERYARSLFDLALESGKVAAVEADLGRFEALLDGSEDLKRLIYSPVFSADDQFKAIVAVADKAKIASEYDADVAKAEGRYAKSMAEAQALENNPNAGEEALAKVHGKGAAAADVSPRG